MGKLKILFWILGLLTLTAGGAYIFAEKSTTELATALRPYTQKLTPVVESLQPLAEQIETPHLDELPEVATLTERTQEISEHVGTVLGNSIGEVDAEQQPLHERAIEYGQYLYCKGIVEEYETSHDVSAPSE
ncbi:hypothetical protein KC721_01660 [Candidatus Woesebacteria bacterium]|nr:hypothetical protein [Candidatus Woesebacteria bacterium]